MAVGANPNLKQRTLIVAGMALGIIAVMVINQVWQTYDATVATARRDVQQFTQILEANTDITFQSVTLILDHAVEATRQRKGDPLTDQAIADRFIAIADNWALIHSVTQVGADGIVHGAVTRGADGRLHALQGPLDASHHPMFLYHRNLQTAGRAFFISRPSRDIASSQRIIGVTKTIYDDAGNFHGFYMVTVAVDAFTRIYAGLLPSRYAAVELFRRDGALLASTNAARKSELSENEKLLIREMVPASTSGVYRITSSGGESGNLLSYRVLERYPIIIAVTANWFQFMARWWESSLVLIISALTGALVIVGLTWWLVRRISAEHSAKQALQKNERNILESQRLSGIGYYEHGLRASRFRWSSNMFEIHGLHPETFSPSNETYIDLVIPEDKPHVLAVWADFERSPRSGSLECRITRPDGELRHIRYSWKILEDGGAGLDRVFGVAQDVTAMRNAEDTIREDEERLRDIVECSSDYIWELNANGAITMFSGAAVLQFGDGADAGFKILTNEASDVEGGDEAALQRSIKNRVKFRSLMVPIKNAKADVRWVRISGNPRFDSQGRYLGYRGAGTDVTEFYHRQERDEAHRRAEALGRLASGMAHEINNLLQPIVIYANLGTAQDGLATIVRQYFGRIGLAAERSMMIVKNVLAFARQSPPSRENVSVLDVVRETVDLIGDTLTPGTSLSVSDGATNDLLVRVDRTGLTQVLANLLTNAAEALPSGGRIGVTVNAVNLAGDAAKALNLAPGLYCRLMVEDNGAGIPADQLGKVFDPFFTTKPQGKGTGLGLSVVSGLAKSWGGAVAVDSGIGAGTCFTVYLPVAEAQLQAAQ